MNNSLFLIILFGVLSPNMVAQSNFDIKTDLLIANYDSKPDVDDLMSVAAFATMLKDARFEELNYVATAGAYGTQGGTFIESTKLFSLSFGEHWVNAHLYKQEALEVLYRKSKSVLETGGNIWIAEAGQSDVSAEVLKLIRERHPEINTKERITLIQHSWWNESVTTPEKLLYVRDYTDYTKIPDGNGLNNGTPGFRTDYGSWWELVLSDKNVGELWKEAKRLADKYNIVAGYNNEAVGAGGFDFSDTSEICWILGFNHLENVDDFFSEFLTN